MMWRVHHNDRQLMIMCSVLISCCVCRRPSWTPKTQPNGSSAVVWLSFWFSTRFTRKKLDHSPGSYLYRGNSTQQGFFFIFLRRGKKLKIQRRLRRAFFAFGIRQLFLLIFEMGDFFRGGGKKVSRFLVGEFPPTSGKKKHWTAP